LLAFAALLLHRLLLNDRLGLLLSLTGNRFGLWGALCCLGFFDDELELRLLLLTDLLGRPSTLLLHFSSGCFLPGGRSGGSRCLYSGDSFSCDAANGLFLDLKLTGSLGYDRVVYYFFG